MKRFYLGFAALLIVCVAVAGCATPLDQSEVARIKSIGVLNSFPDHPNYKIIGTTIFENTESEIREFEYKAIVYDSLKSYLEGRGYAVSPVSSREDVSREDIDLVIEILPRQARDRPYTFGYGFVQKSFLGTSETPKSYVALNLIPVTGRAQNPFNAYYEENFSILGVATLPSKWEDLTPLRKRYLSDNLLRNIEETIAKVAPKLGL